MSVDVTFDINGKAVARVGDCAFAPSARACFRSPRAPKTSWVTAAAIPVTWMAQRAEPPHCQPEPGHLVE
ncbi:hypothetical protein [Denitromonas sp.]|uniref:hypothetical protein n=1 Tax=Denitromonas sp. TaxID=2734609 RepID=UPI002AFF41F9|nr:hypothetical protein [Denitromonas sp.]